MRQGQAMYIKRIRLVNIRGFHDLDLKVVGENGRPRMRTVIVGINGTCKTTLLRCIAMGLCGVGDANALLAEDIGRLITENKDEATIEIDLAGGGSTTFSTTVVTKLSTQKDKEFVQSQKSQERSLPPLLVVAYGVGRSLSGKESFRTYRIMDSVYTLFNYEAQLIPTEIVLRRLQDYLGTKTYEKTKRGIISALGLPEDIQIILPKGGGVEVMGLSIGERIPLEAWADGYRITFSWIVDLYAWAMRADAVTPSGGIKGILLVDELEQHLHPSMQTNVVPRLKELWPDMQVFGTTHSPLVALGASPDEVVVLRRDGETVYSSDTIPNFGGYSTEDMLRDEDLFDTEVYAPETNKKLSEYKNLLRKNKDKMSKYDKIKLKKLTTELRAQQVLLEQETPTELEFEKLRKELGL